MKRISVTESTVESELNMYMIQLSSNKQNIVIFFLLMYFHVFCINVDKHLKANLYYELTLKHCSLFCKYFLQGLFALRLWFYVIFWL